MQGLADAARCRSGERLAHRHQRHPRPDQSACSAPAPATWPPSAASRPPTLAIVYNRELEIRNFKPRGYWRITANFGVAKGSYEGVYQRPDFKKNDDEHDRIDRLWVKKTAEAIVAACQGQPVASVTEEKKGSTSAPPALTT